MTRLFLILILLGGWFTKAKAYVYDFEYQGLYYVINSIADLSVSLCSPPDDVDYPDNLVIPSTVEFNGKTLFVRGFAQPLPSNIVSIYIPNTIFGLPNNVFDNCSSLTSVTIEDGTEDILIGHGPEYREKVNGSYTTCYRGLFYNCPLISAYLGRNVVLGYSLERDWDYSIFERLQTLQSIVIGDNCKKVIKRSFKMCNNLKTVRLPSNLQTIDIEAFYSCKSLESIAFPESLTKIEIRSFLGCMRLNEIIIPSGVSFLRNGTFQGCDSLTRIIFMGKTNLEYCVFGYGNEPTANVYVYSSEPATITSESFSHNTFLQNLYVPKGTKELYSNTTGWNNFWNIIELDEVTPPLPNSKCATPTVNYSNGQIQFECETDGVTFVSSVICDDNKNHNTSIVPLTAIYRISVYAKKDGYDDSDIVTKEISIRGLKGDVNEDGEVNIADINSTINIILSN
jgi:hypothetical protein